MSLEGGQKQRKRKELRRYMSLEGGQKQRKRKELRRYMSLEEKENPYFCFKKLI
jgi:hypothetical protein